MSLERVKSAYRETYESRGLDDIEKRIDSRIKRKRSRRALFILRERLENLEEKKVLAVGCGKGELIVTFGLEDIDICGVTPDRGEIEVAESWQSHYGLENRAVEGRGEDLPFPDESFDLVIAHDVLEHVQDMEKTVSEMARVAKRGGHLYIRAPNYRKPREGHYDLFWIPFMPKALGRLYLRLLGRPTCFLNTIHYTSPGKVRKSLEKHDLTVFPLNKAGFFSPIELLARKD